MGNTTASLTREQLFGGGVTIDGAAEIQSELRDRRDKKPSSELNFAPSKAGRVACFYISIHALREEGDSKNRDKISIFL